MSRWSTMERITVVRRPDPNSGATWALTWVTAGLWAAGVLVVLGPSVLQLGLGGPPDLAPLIPLALVRLVAGVVLAYVDDADARRRLGRRLAHPLLALLSPAIYLLVRMLRERDPRGGKPFWVGFAVCAAAVVLPVLVVTVGF